MTVLYCLLSRFNQLPYNQCCSSLTGCPLTLSWWLLPRRCSPPFHHVSRGTGARGSWVGPDAWAHLEKVLMCQRKSRIERNDSWRRPRGTGKGWTWNQNNRLWPVCFIAVSLLSQLWQVVNTTHQPCYTSKDHSHWDFQVQIIEKVTLNTKYFRLEREEFWIQTLQLKYHLV